jgi:hypothetical protein
MSRFDSIYAAAVPTLTEHLGRSIKYLDPQTDSVTLTALVGNTQTEETEGQDGRRRRVTRSVTISTDPTSADGGIASPGEHAELEIDEERWGIEAIESLSGSLVRLLCVRLGSVERSREGYRRRR